MGRRKVDEKEEEGEQKEEGEMEKEGLKNVQTWTGKSERVGEREREREHGEGETGNQVQAADISQQTWASSGVEVG